MKTLYFEFLFHFVCFRTNVLHVMSVMLFAYLLICTYSSLKTRNTYTIYRIFFSTCFSVLTSHKNCLDEILYFLKSESIHSEKNPNLLKKLVVESRTKEARKHGQKCATKGNRIIFPCKILLRLKGMFVAFAAFKCHLTRRKGVRFHEG